MPGLHQRLRTLLGKPGELSCEELVELVTDYLEGALPRRDGRRFEQHLAECEGCEAYLDQMRRTIELTGRLCEETLPAGARETYLEVFRDWKRA